MQHRGTAVHEGPPCMPEESPSRKQLRADATRLGVLPFPAGYDDPMMENDYDGFTVTCFKCQKPIRKRREITHVDIPGCVRPVHRACAGAVEADDLIDYLRDRLPRVWE